MPGSYHFCTSIPLGGGETVPAPRRDHPPFHLKSLAFPLSASFTKLHVTVWLMSAIDFSVGLREFRAGRQKGIPFLPREKVVGAWAVVAHTLPPSKETSKVILTCSKHSYQMLICWQDIFSCSVNQESTGGKGHTILSRQPACDSWDHHTKLLCRGWNTCCVTSWPHKPNGCWSWQQAQSCHKQSFKEVIWWLHWETPMYLQLPTRLWDLGDEFSTSWHCHDIEKQLICRIRRICYLQYSLQPRFMELLKRGQGKGECISSWKLRAHMIPWPLLYLWGYQRWMGGEEQLCHLLIQDSCFILRSNSSYNPPSP